MLVTEMMADEAVLIRYATGKSPEDKRFCLSKLCRIFASRAATAYRRLYCFQCSLFVGVSMCLFVSTITLEPFEICDILSFLCFYYY